MRLWLIRLLVGRPRPYPTGQEKISSVWDACLWRLASLPGLDASLRTDETVSLHWKLWADLRWWWISRR